MVKTLVEVIGAQINSNAAWKLQFIVHEAAP